MNPTQVMIANLIKVGVWGWQIDTLASGVCIPRCRTIYPTRYRGGYWSRYIFTAVYNLKSSRTAGDERELDLLASPPVTHEPLIWNVMDIY